MTIKMGFLKSSMNKLFRLIETSILATSINLNAKFAKHPIT